MNQTGRLDPDSIRLERIIRAPRETVFDAWLTAETLRLWWPAGSDWETPVAEVEPRVGGRLRLVMRSPAGEEFGGTGEFTELERPELRFLGQLLRVRELREIELLVEPVRDVEPAHVGRRERHVHEGRRLRHARLGEPVKIVDLAHNMIRLAGYEPEVDIAIEVVGRRPGEKIHEELFNPGERPHPTPAEKIVTEHLRLLQNHQVPEIAQTGADVVGVEDSGLGHAA